MGARQHNWVTWGATLASAGLYFGGRVAADKLKERRAAKRAGVSEASDQSSTPSRD